MKGPENAPITIVEFSDYQCPFCARTEPLVEGAARRLPEPGALVYKHFPLVSIHPQALPAALAAAAAQQQGKFWEMHDDAVRQPARPAARSRSASTRRQIGLDLAKFDADIASDEVKAAVQEDMRLAQRVGVRGTPTMFVNGKLLQNRSVDGFKAARRPDVEREGRAAGRDQKTGELRALSRRIDLSARIACPSHRGRVAVANCTQEVCHAGV